MKTDRVAHLLAPYSEAAADRHYLAFVDCFNGGRFFEAHEVLEVVWLAERGRERELFLKGFIQLAGAFVHVQHNRPGPAAALLRLAHANLRLFPPGFEGLNVETVLTCVETCLERLRAGDTPGSLRPPRVEYAG